jgi:hypothetical protein
VGVADKVGEGFFVEVTNGITVNVAVGGNKISTDVGVKLGVANKLF